MNKQSLQPLSCVMIGEQSLLIRCAQRWLESGQSIAAVVARNSAIVEWAEREHIPVFANAAVLPDALSAPFDYLFSVTNLRILPEAVLKLPTRMAVNFHDGPLPDYAGLNVPVWALLAGEPQHGVTWHEMTTGVDEGDILVESRFDIAPDETAFSLNGRCYQAAIESFEDLLAQITTNSLRPRKQELEGRKLIGVADRPCLLLDWSSAAEDIKRTVRALDFGPYENPIGLLHLYLGAESLLVRSAETVPDVAAAAGTLLDYGTDWVIIGTATDAVRLSLVSANGAVADVESCLRRVGLQKNSALPALPAVLVDTLAQVVSRACRREPEWKLRLGNAEPVEIPYPGDPSHTGGRERVAVALPPPLRNAGSTIAGVALLLARLSGKGTFTLAYQSRASASIPTELAPFFAETLPLQITGTPDQSFSSFTATLARELSAAEDNVSHLRDLTARDTRLLSATSSAQYPIRITWSGATPEKPQPNPAALCFVVQDSADHLLLDFSPASLSLESAHRLAAQLEHLFAQLAADPAQPISKYSVVPEAEAAKLRAWNETALDYPRDRCVHHLFEQQTGLNPDRVAYICEDEQISYADLNRRANRLARHLREHGAAPGDRIGIWVERSLDMVTAMLAVLKAGAAYIPLDPAYPADRLTMMVEDSHLRILITQSQFSNLGVEGKGSSTLEHVLLDGMDDRLARYNSTNLDLPIDSGSLAYMIYTSGSTGRPKGVMVTHRNVANFFAGMDQRIEPEDGTWLAVTSMSFDISVLELFWTLSRGMTVVLLADDKKHGAGDAPVSAFPDRSVDFGLFYWNVVKDGEDYAPDKYRLLLEGAKYADKNGFNAVWTPERHFASFGGIFPNPAVTGAAVAAITERVSVRAGSCVVPLHSPIRIAEEWAVVDNLSQGRTAIAIAAGWAAPDFAIKPENFGDAKSIMFKSVETVRKLWRGDTVEFPGPDGKPIAVRTLPRPVQTELPIWVTTAGNVDTYRAAGKMGANVLTHLLGQTVDEVAEKVLAYREAWRIAGHPGSGIVTLMLHTFVSPDAEYVEQQVRGPLKEYLKSAMFLVKSAAWQFPTFKKMSDEQGKTLDEFFATISDEDMDGLLEFAFHRYFTTSGLFGTPQHCLGMVDRVKAADIDEIACLIDFGIETQIALDNLVHLGSLRELANRKPARARSSVPDLLKRHRVTHLQCTPSMATMLVEDESARGGLAALTHLMVGGEALPPELASSLAGLVSGRVTNMYGPTETTIWSSTDDISLPVGLQVSIGRPLPNQTMHVLDAQLQPLPIGAVGELVIGGEGVTRGYFERPDLTTDRFAADPYVPGARMYRTGDLARVLPDGRVECLGRVDDQIKIRGYRVELGEIAARLREDPSVTDAVVTLREDTPGDKRLVAYVREANTERHDAAAGVPVSLLPEARASALKAALARHLPDFMVPSVFVRVERIPQTPNGKVDRKALPPPPRARAVPASEVATSAPQSDLETMVAEIWARALGTESVGRNENFFDIGGHSLLIVPILKDLRARISKPIQMTDLFRYTTVATLARYLAEDPEKKVKSNVGEDRAAARRASMARRRQERTD